MPPVEGARPSKATTISEPRNLHESRGCRRLRSGGPLMLVRKIEGDQVTCYWSTDEGNVLSGSFPIADFTAPITLPAPIK
jgi:hypothetical protein